MKNVAFFLHRSLTFPKLIKSIKTGQNRLSAHPINLWERCSATYIFQPRKTFNILTFQFALIDSSY